ncbi:hypothetical protein SAMN05216464_110220 [Mucilaginibacter pineti]|uniref:Uncharacterized protein n=1 Tax=Mucilaginibacter pineti TaxID=1391627 RepID=A0A1G7GNE3_9SPHI|nr:hypothetical protein [Mucilaginibacter pineti]SDE89509.1 hypothetical protein SAMN05216464_110220 [Mucilaginibacter pineti]
MDQIQLYLNYQLVDLMDDSPIALTFQINNLAEVKNQQGNTSNQFKLPLTQRNRQILGFPDDVAFTTLLPYDNYDARIIQDGLEIVPYGIAQLNLIEQDTASITVLSGNVDFFDSLDVKIYDMGDSTTTVGQLNAFGPYEHTWNLQTVALSQIKTEGYIWPVVDYGKIAIDFKNSPQIDVRYLRPGFFLKTAINLFAQTTGYKINPQSFLLQQPMYDKLIVQFANDNFEHGGDTQNKPDEYGLTALVNGTQTIRHLKTSDGIGTVAFSNIVADGKKQFDGTTFTSKIITTANIIVTIPRARLDGRVTGYPASVSITLNKGGTAGIEELTTINYDFSEWNPNNRTKGSGGNIYGWQTFGAKSLSIDTDLAINDRIYISYHFSGNTQSSIEFYADASMVIKSVNTNVLYKQQVQCERIFPDITQKDLLKDTLQHFGIICQTDNTNRTVTFSSFREIVGNIPVAVNWTSKCIDQGKTVSFQLGNYAQVNTMTYKDDDSILPKNLGNAQINVKDKTLPLSTALFESQFAPTLNRPYIGDSIAQILKVDTSQDTDAIDFSISTQPRLLIDQKLNLQGSAAIAFTDGDNQVMVNDTISVPYFYKPGGEYSLLWEDLRIAYYPELEKILSQTKKVVRYLLLTPRDILDLDLLIPVYLEQDSCYYYINKIDSWRKGQPVKVELVKLG